MNRFIVKLFLVGAVTLLLEACSSGDVQYDGTDIYAPCNFGADTGRWCVTIPPGFQLDETSMDEELYTVLWKEGYADSNTCQCRNIFIVSEASPWGSYGTGGSSRDWAEWVADRMRSDGRTIDEVRSFETDCGNSGYEFTGISNDDPSMKTRTGFLIDSDGYLFTLSSATKDSVESGPIVDLYLSLCLAD